MWRPFCGRDAALRCGGCDHGDHRAEQLGDDTQERATASVRAGASTAAHHALHARLDLDRAGDRRRDAGAHEARPRRARSLRSRVARQILGAGFLVALAALPRRWRGERDVVTHALWTRRDLLLLVTLSWAGFALPQILGAVGLERSSATHGALLSPLEPIASCSVRRSCCANRSASPISSPAHLEYWDRVDRDLGRGRRAHRRVARRRHHGRRSSVLGDLHAGREIAGGASRPAPRRALRDTAVVDPARAARRDGTLRRGACAAGARLVVLLAFLATALGMVAWNRALREVSAGTMALFVFVQPVVGLAVGVAALANG